VNMISRPAAPQPNLSVGQALERAAYEGRCQAIAFALPDVPADLLTEWRQREACRRFKFFPTPAEIADWLAPDLAARRETAERRQMLAAPPPQPRPERTPEEIAAARAKVQEFRAGLAETKREARSDQARPLSEGHLLAQYEALAAKGNAVAAFRAKALRTRYARQLAQEAAE
jgi:hypothetical protein